MSNLFASVRSAVIGVIVVLVLGIPSGAIAQAPVSSFEQLPTRLRVGDTVYVTDAGGGEHKGKLTDLSASSLALQAVGTPRRFLVTDVSTITRQRPDSVIEGTLIGLGAGAGVGYALAVDVYDYHEEGLLILPLMFAGIGAAAGALIDALIPGKKVLVYSAPSASSATRVGVSPLVSSRRQGLAVSVRF